jgi:hypothetical protein
MGLLTLCQTFREQKEKPLANWASGWELYRFSASRHRPANVAVVVTVNVLVAPLCISGNDIGSPRGVNCRSIGCSGENLRAPLVIRPAKTHLILMFDSRYHDFPRSDIRSEE